MTDKTFIDFFTTYNLPYIMGNINPIINRETFLPHNFDHLQYDYFLTLSVIQHDYILKLFLGWSQNHYSSESFQHFYSMLFHIHSPVWCFVFSKILKTIAIKIVHLKWHCEQYGTKYSRDKTFTVSHLINIWIKTSMVAWW